MLLLIVEKFYHRAAIAGLIIPLDVPQFKLLILAATENKHGIFREQQELLIAAEQGAWGPEVGIGGLGRVMAAWGGGSSSNKPRENFMPEGN